MRELSARCKEVVALFCRRQTRHARRNKHGSRPRYVCGRPRSETRTWRYAMLIRSGILAVFVLALLAPAVAADEGHGRGRGRGDDDSQGTFASANAVSTDLGSGRAGAGAADPNVVVTLPGASSAAAAIVCSSQPSGWAAALGGTAWISPIASCTNDQATGQYRYDITFSLPSGATNLRLTGSLLSDDTVSLQLNGHGVTLSSVGSLRKQHLRSDRARLSSDGDHAKCRPAGRGRRKPRSVCVSGSA